MMGHTHALSGALVWLAAVPLLERADLMQQYALHLDTKQLAAGTVVSAGAALLPDIDHHNGRIANTLGPISQHFCKWVGKVSGGHRNATHSLLFAVGTGWGVDWLATHQRYAWWAVLFIIVGFGLRGIGLDFKGQEPQSALADCALAAFAVWWMHDLDMGFVGWAIGIGCVAHIIGDCLTPRGCPVLWPIPMRVELPVVPRTNGKVEHMVIVPLLILGTVILAVRSALGETATQWLNKG
ncbi:metal-dependent hydrolase [Actinomadura logoneensis]|nr:metal-dependent hydrolase [Actinomadura logoneensis]